MNLFKSLSNGRQSVSIIKDPFQKDCIESIQFWFWNDIRFTSNPTWEATVKFRNGQTSGEQKFKCDDFGVLVKQVEEFIKTL